MKILIVFTILSIINVVFSTYKSLATIKGSVLNASIVSALYYGFYNVVLIYTVADFPLWQKVAITAVCNFIGVYIVKYIEKRMRKTKTWKFELTVPADLTETIHTALDSLGVSHNYIPNIGKYTIYNCYCPTQRESTLVKTIANNYDIKYFISESENT